MKRLALCLLLATAPAFAAEFGWKCPGGEIGTGRASPCLGGVKLYLDDMNAAQLNAYTKALAAQDRREESARRMESAKRKAEQDAELAALYKLCGRFTSGLPAIGMTEAQFAQCAGMVSPTSKNHTTTAQGRVTQYVYRIGNSYSFYYFRNGILTTIQD